MSKHPSRVVRVILEVVVSGEAYSHRDLAQDMTLHLRDGGFLARRSASLRRKVYFGQLRIQEVNQSKLDLLNREARQQAEVRLRDAERRLRQLEDPHQE